MRSSRKFVPRAAAIVAASLFLVTPVFAEEGDWLGQRVFVRETAQPKVGNRILKWSDIAIPAKVSQVNGDWLWVGKAWVRSGDVVRLDDAPAYYTKTIRSQPGAAYAYLLRGMAWSLKRDYENAIKDFSEAIRLEPGVPMVYQARATAYHALHEYEKALADLTEAIRLSPDTALFYNDRGCVYKNLGNYKKAQEQLSEAIRIDPKLALAWSNSAVNWHVQKEYAKAMEDFNRAIEIDPKLAHAYNFRGYAWSKQGHYSQALKDWDESIRIAPDEPWGYYGKARMYATCISLGHRDGDMALEAAQKACELSHWDEWVCVAALAAAYAEKENFDEAVSWQKKAIAMNKNPEERDTREQNERLKLYESGMPFRDPEVSDGS